jgi:hypothetical protein
MENVGSFCGHLECAYYGHSVIYVVVIWYIFTRFGILHHEKSGNPGADHISDQFLACFSTFFCETFTG